MLYLARFMIKPDMEWYSKGLVYFWLIALLPSCVIGIFNKIFLKVFDRSVAQVNEAIPKLANHWKNPIYWICTLIAGISRLVFLPMDVLFRFIDGKDMF